MAAVPADAPVAGHQRIDLLDALRGFALAGVLVANLTAFSLCFFLPPSAASGAWADRLLEPALDTLVSNRFLSLFSLLFGVGFVLHVERTGGTRAGLRRYLRRLLVLLAIGLLHAVFWWGDILRYYAVLGFLLVPMRHLRPRTLALAGLLFACVLHPAMTAFWDTPADSIATRAQAYAAALAAFSDPRWPAMLRGNLAFNDWWLVARLSHCLWIAGCLLLGAALGRAGVIAAPAAHRRFWRRMLWLLPIGLAGSLLVLFADYGHLGPLTARVRTPAGVFALKWTRDAAVLALAAGYMAAIVALFARPATRRALLPLASVGRMALSNYLAQTAIGIALFYGVGLGIGPHHGLAGVVVAWALLFAAQVALSRWWLARFRFGPAEWAWRSLTYGTRQPMRRESAAPERGSA